MPTACKPTPGQIYQHDDHTHCFCEVLQGGRETATVCTIQRFTIRGGARVPYAAPKRIEVETLSQFWHPMMATPPQPVRDQGMLLEYRRLYGGTT